MSTKALYEGGLSELVVDVAGKRGEIILTVELLREDSAIILVDISAASLVASFKTSLIASAESRGTSKHSEMQNSISTVVHSMQ